MSVQYVSDSIESLFVDQCSVRVHTWPWQKAITEITHTPHNIASCQRNAVMETGEGGLYRIQFKPTCGHIFVNISYKETVTRLYSHKLHPKFHFKDIKVLVRNTLLLGSLSEVNKNYHEANMDSVTDVWAITSMDSYMRKLFYRPENKHGSSLLQELPLRELQQVCCLSYFPPLVENMTLITFHLANENSCHHLTFKYSILHIGLRKEIRQIDKQVILGYQQKSKYSGVIDLTGLQNVTFKSAALYHYRFLLMQPVDVTQLPCYVRVSINDVNFEQQINKDLPVTFTSRDPIEKLGYNHYSSTSGSLKHISRVYLVTWQLMELSWQQAERKCRIIGGHLPTASTTVESNIIKRLILGKRWSNIVNTATPARLTQMTLVYIVEYNYFRVFLSVTNN